MKKRKYTELHIPSQLHQNITDPVALAYDVFHTSGENYSKVERIGLQTNSACTILSQSDTTTFSFPRIPLRL